MNERIPLIINARAGSAPQATLIAETFATQGAAAEVHDVRSPDRLPGTIERALVGRPARVAVAGGDGTVSAVAACIAGTETALGVLPLGTLNHFARDAGIPETLADAVATVVHGSVTRVDVARVNGHFFLNNSSLGLYARVVRVREWEQTRLRRRKWFAFFSAALRSLRRYPFMDVHIDSPVLSLDRRTPLVFVGSNRYILEGLEIGRRSDLASGELTVCIARVHSRWDLILLAFNALFGRARGAPQLDVFATPTVRVSSRRRKVLVALDGEVRRMEAPLHYTLERGALRLLVPAADAPSE